MKKSNFTFCRFRMIIMMLFLMALGLEDALANDPPSPDIPDNMVKMQTVEPERDVGYTVGDLLDRDVTLEVKKPFKLIETSLPIVGYERRYKGQVIGIELRKISHSTSENDGSTIYHLHLTYQVFTNNVVAKAAFLPAEILKFTNISNGEVVQYRIPEWGFRISPLAIYGSVKIEQDMSPFRGPLLLDASKDQLNLKIFIGILTVSLIGIFYIVGKLAWLPIMGRPFAVASRKINRLSSSPENIKKGIAIIHDSLNLTAGNSLFNDNLDFFLTQRPQFIPLRKDFQRFFGLSHHVFFSTENDHDTGSDALYWLKEFCRSCRDCERGLIPELPRKKS